MAEFGPSITEAPQTPNYVTPKEGIVKEPAGVQAVASIFGIFADERKKQRATKAQEALSRFTNDQLAIIQAVDQGSRSSQFGRTQMRANLMKMINDYPALRGEIIKANAGIIGAGGMGGLIESGTKDELAREKRRGELVSQGLLSTDSSDAEFREVERQEMIAAEATRRYKSTMDTIALEMAATNLSSAKRKELEDKRSFAAKEFLVNTAPSLMNNFKVTADKILGLINKPGADTGNLVSLLEERWNEFETQMSVPLSQTDSHTASAIMKGYREYYDLVSKRAKGEYTQEEYDRKEKRTLSIFKSQMLADEGFAKMVAATELFGSSDVLISMGNRLDVMRKLSTYLNSNTGLESQPANLFDDSAEGREAMKSYFKVVGQDPNDLTDAQKQEQITNIRNILSGVEDYESFLARNPEKGIALVTDWMSTQEFYKLRKANPELFENTETVSRILQSNYGDEVWGMVKKEFRDNKILRQEATDAGAFSAKPKVKFSETATPDAVSYRSTSNGVEFFAVNSDDREASMKASRLNKTLAPVINKNIKAFAHLDGSNDYRAYWEKVDQDIMSGGMGNEELAGGDAGDDLTIQDFTPKQMAGISNKLTALIDKTEAGGNYDTLLGHSQKTIFTDIKATDMTVDEVIAFQNSSAYRNYSKEVVGRVATPIGRYQIVGKTLKALKEKLGLTGEERFDEAMQDRMYNTLLQYRLKVAGGSIDKAMTQLRAEWEGLKHVSNADLRAALEEAMNEST